MFVLFFQRFHVAFKDADAEILPLPPRDEIRDGLFVFYCIVITPNFASCVG